MPIIAKNITKNHSKGTIIPTNDKRYRIPNKANIVTPTFDTNFIIFSTKKSPLQYMKW